MPTVNKAYVHRQPAELAACRAQLTAAGLKPTQQRLAILSALNASHEHLSAETLHAQLRPQYPTLSLGTVYRTLEVLADAAVIKRVATPNGILLFDAKLHAHHHLVHAETGHIEDYEDDALNQLLSDYFRKKPIPGFRITDFQLNLTGAATGKNQPVPGTRKKA